MPDTLLLPATRLARSHPLEGVADIPGVCVLPPLTRVALHGDIAFYAGIELPRTPLRALLSDETAVLWLGPEEWLVLSPEGEEVVPGNGSVVDVSHRQVALELSGPGAALRLAAACPLDLDLVACPVGFCSRTVFGKAQIALWRKAEEVFHVEVARSFAAYVHGLLRAAL